MIASDDKPTDSTQSAGCPVMWLDFIVITERLPYQHWMMHNFCWISNNRSGVGIYIYWHFSSSTAMVVLPSLL